MENLDIKPYDKTIKDLLKSGRQFNIPRFQREYSWDKRHYDEFLDDIFKCIQFSEDSIETSTYFLGTMVFIGNFVEKGNKQIQVVDGQQRITTITILFSAISELFRKAGKEGLSKLIFEYIMTKDDDGNVVRIIKSDTSYPFFSYYIQDWKKENLEEPDSEEEMCIKETYDYFLKQLSEKAVRLYIKKHHGEDISQKVEYVDVLKAIRDQVLSCVFVSISSNNEAQANRIFEILNAKGKKLSYIDLIKNKIFEELNDTEPADFAAERWSSIKETINECGSSAVGFGTFFRHYWASAYGAIQQSKLYDTFCHKVKTEDYKNFLNSLLENSKYYVQILKPKREDYDNRKEYYWLVQSFKIMTDYFNIIQIRVVLMSLLWARKSDVISSKKFKEAILFLENFHFAYTAIMSGKANKLDTIYSQFSVALRGCKDKASCNSVIEEKLYKPLKELCPSKDKFVENFKQMSYTKQSTPSNLKCKYAINKINAFIQGKEIFEDDLSIEHIYPEANGDESLNVGNLIALETALNNDAGMQPYEDKVTIYRKSKYVWVAKFIEEHRAWTKEEIQNRAGTLAEYYYDNILKI